MEFDIWLFRRSVAIARQRHVVCQSDSRGVAMIETVFLFGKDAKFEYNCYSKSSWLEGQPSMVFLQKVDA